VSDTATDIDWPLVLDWIEALESGEYEQCRNALRKGEAYCAIGVVVDLADPDGWNLSAVAGSDCCWQDARPVVCRLGLPTGGWDQVLTLNDHHGYSLPEIAAVLRKWYGLAD
jgi:hypothetical protein